MSQQPYVPIYPASTGAQPAQGGYAAPTYGQPPPQPNAYTGQAAPYASVAMPNHQPESTGFWSDGLCSCFDDCNSLLCSWCCPCIRWPRTMERAGFGTFMQFLLKWLGVFVLVIGAYVCEILMWSLEDCTTDTEGPYSSYTITTCTMNYAFLVLYYVFTFLTAVYYIYIGFTGRQRLKERYQITEGDQCTDCLQWWCCSCCAMAQEARHVDRMEGFLGARQ